MILLELSSLILNLIFVGRSSSLIEIKGDTSINPRMINKINNSKIDFSTNISSAKSRLVGRNLKEKYFQNKNK